MPLGYSLAFGLGAGSPPNNVSPVGPSTVGTLVFDAEVGAKVKFSWSTDVQKSYSGKESRRSRNSLPRMTFTGDAVLLASNIQDIRSLLAKYAAQGSKFLVGLPWEEATLVADGLFATLYVKSTAVLDWAEPGQRVIVVGADETNAIATIQSVDATSITVNVDVTTIGARGGRVMPAIPVLLDPQQGFARYRPRDVAERWQLVARSAVAGFVGTPAVSAQLALADPVTYGSETQSIVLVSRLVGAAGNGIVVTQTDDAITSGGEMIEDVGAKTLHIKYLGNGTTMTEYSALLASSALVAMTGAYTGTDVVAAGDDAFTARNLTGGVDAGTPQMGLGTSALATHSGHPVFDRAITVPDTASDSLQSMSEILDMGGVLTGIGMSLVADWGRDVTMVKSDPDDWQWLKLFLFTVRGAQRAFWLPSGRSDLTVAP